MFDPFGGDDSLGAWLFEQQSLEVEEEIKRKKEEELNISHKVDSRHSLYEDFRQDNMNYKLNSDKTNNLNNPQIKDGSVKFMRDIKDLSKSFDYLEKEMNKAKTDAELELANSNNIKAEEIIDKYIIKATGFINGALALAKKYRNEGNDKAISACLGAVKLCEETIKTFSAVKEMLPKNELITPMKDMDDFRISLQYFLLKSWINWRLMLS
jgi:hypothetical protein